MKILKYILIAIAIILILIGVYFLINGSLEMFPTDEQQGKARIAGAVIMLFGFVIGVIGILVKKKTS